MSLELLAPVFAAAPPPAGPVLGAASRVGSANAFGLSSPNPGGLCAHNGALYMVAWISGGPGASLFTLNPTTGVATRVGNAVNFGLNPAEDVPGALASHGGVLYMVGDRTHNLYTVNTTTGVATRVGASTNFGINETGPTGLASLNGLLYLLGRSRGLSTLNTTTGVATVIAAVSGGAGSVHGLTAHGTTLYLLADTQRALFSINPRTAAATRVGRADAFGVAENDPRGVASFDKRLLMVGNTLDALLELNAPPLGVWHSFNITAGQSGAATGASRGYNGPGRFGAIQSGFSAAYNTPVGKWVTCIHARRVGSNMNFALANAADAAADFPTRIVVTKLTGGVVERAFTPTGGRSSVTGGRRQDYAPESGSPTDVFVNNASIRLDLYY